MCELLGISCSLPTSPQPYFGLFRKRGKVFPDGEGNPDGWGIAYYPDGKAVQVIKESIPAASSKLARFVSGYDMLRSQIFICHVRKASKGAVAFSNSHPFSRVLRRREMVMAHNGTIRKFPKSPRARYKPLGTTDSEKLFCHILDHIRQKRTIEWNEDDLIEFWKFLISINRLTDAKAPNRPNKLNLLLADGEILLAYTDLYGRGTLHQLLLQENRKVLSDDSDLPGYRPLKDKRAMATTVIATKPLSGDKNWDPMHPGELCAVRDGVVVFSSGSVAINDKPGPPTQGGANDLR